MRMNQPRTPARPGVVRIALPALIGLAVTSTAISSQAQTIPLKTLTDLKKATVLVKTEAGDVGGSGTGFVMKVEGTTGYIVTNHHVVVLPEELVAGPARTRVRVVFNSGSRLEKTYESEIVAADDDRDLAILRVKGVKDLPKPININAKPELVETMSVLILGFPLGTSITNVSRLRNPAITVNRGTISSIRLNDLDQVERIQIDGGMIPGNSGGPVVDTQGQLVGVAVARIRGEQIGLCIPPEHLSKMLNGRVGGMVLKQKGVLNGTAELTAEAQLIDPMSKIKSVAFYYVRANTLRKEIKARDDGTWAPLPGARKIVMKIQGQKAVATFKVPTSSGSGRNLVIQAAYVNGEGKTIHTSPGPFEIELDAAPESNEMPVRRAIRRGYQ